MAFDATEALKGTAQGALTAAPSGNPYLIGGSALVGGLAQGFSKPKPFNAAPYRDAMRRLRRNMRQRAARDKREVASQTATMLNSKGLDGSALGVGIAAGNQRMIDQKTNDYLNQLESDLEFHIADTQTGIDRRWDAQKRQNTLNLGLTGIGLIRDIYTPDANDTQFLKDLQTKLGLETYDEQQQKQWNQFVEQRKDLNAIDGNMTTGNESQTEPLGPYAADPTATSTDPFKIGSMTTPTEQYQPDPNAGKPWWEKDPTLGPHQPWYQRTAAEKQGAKSVTAGDSAMMQNLDLNDTVRVVAEVMPRGTVVTADPKLKGVVHIEPPGSGISFTNNSYIGNLHLEHPLGIMELAKHVEFRAYWYRSY